jgi:hypothetical protein
MSDAHDQIFGGALEGKEEKMNCPFCLSDDIRADEQTLYCCTCRAHFVESDLPTVPERLVVTYNYETQPASYPPGSQAIHGRNGAVVRVGDHAYKPGCCERPRNEHQYVWEKQ